jgi:4-amino-4-deoxy-L-arabinose transferase-like glycosyltransferase
MTTRQFLIVFVLGLVLRIGILTQTSTLGTPIMDEQQYSQIARTVAAGDGYGWDSHSPTSIRPPLYPGLLASTWTLFGAGNLQAVRVIQIVLSALTAALVYLLGANIWGARVGRLAAAIFWLYPSFIFYDYLILTETLFTCLLIAFVWATVRLVQEPRLQFALACGLFLGLAALTRSVLWPLPLILCPALVAVLRVSWTQRVTLAATVLAVYAVVVGPWAIRNSRLQHVFTVVDTMGGMNLRMGNYEYTPDDRMWDAVALEGEKNWVFGINDDLGTGPITEGQKEKWAQRKAIAYMRTHPSITARRWVIKFADFWGLEREFMAGVQKGMYSPPLWFDVVASAAILLAYVVVAVLGALGIWLAAPHDRRIQAALLVPVLVLIGAHTIVFGHSRYHLPLIPILGLYAAALVTDRVPVLAVSRRPALVGAVASTIVLVAVWVRQIAVTDLDRIMSLIHRVS